MENQQGNNPIESIMSTTMENLKDMIDVNVVVGDAVETGAGATIIPISRVSFGFVAGGGEYGCGAMREQEENLPFAGGAGAGVSVTYDKKKNQTRPRILHFLNIKDSKRSVR